MRANQELTQEEFLEQKTELLQEKGGIQDKLGDNNNSADIWLELCTKYLNNAFSARETMENGTPEEKRNLILDLGQNLILKDKKLEFSFKNEGEMRGNGGLRTINMTSFISPSGIR